MKKRVLYLHPHFTLPGGAGRHALETGKELARRGWDVHIASIRHADSLIAGCDTITFHQLGGPLSSSLLFWIRLPLVLLQVRRLIKELKPDIVFSQVFPANWWGFFAKATMGDAIKHVWMCQEPSAFIHSKRWINALPYSAPGIAARVLNPILKILDRSFAKHIDAVFANSNFSKQLAIDAYAYPETSVGICYPGVDARRFCPAPELATVEKQFVTCARLTRFKNVDKILRAFTKITTRGASLIIIGDGEEYDRLVELSRQLSLERAVVFRKSVSDAEMVTALRESVALIHAAEEEPFGLAPVEAMACGTPVIAIKGGGPAETIVHGETGYLCDSAAPEDLAVAIDYMMTPALRSAASLAACVERARRFSWQAATDELDRTFSNLLNHAS
jgi:glycosyltransferase involved in cell wall biosynthesis